MFRSLKISRSATAALATLFVLLCTVSSSPAAVQDGRIAFVSDRGGSWQIYTMNPDGYQGRFQ